MSKNILWIYMSTLQELHRINLVQVYLWKYILVRKTFN